MMNTRWTVLPFCLLLVASVALAGCTTDTDDEGDGGDGGDGGDVGEEATPTPTRTPMNNTTAPEPGSEEATPADRTVVVTMVDSAFEPQELWVEEGSTIHWNNEGQQIHTVSFDAGPYDSGDILPGEDYAVTLGEMGTYTYHCTYHAAQGMTGTIHVVAGSA